MLGLFARDAPFAFDFFLLVMLALLPVMGFAIVQVRHRRVGLHRVLMALSYGLFLVALVDFEWAARTMEDRPPLPALAMTIHLCFAIPTLALWTYQIATGRSAPLQPRRHAKLGRAIFSLLIATVGTGVWVYHAMFG